MVDSCYLHPADLFSHGYRTMTYASLATAPTALVPAPPENDEQKKWKLLDKHLCGFIAVTLNNNLQLHV